MPGALIEVTTVIVDLVNHPITRSVVRIKLSGLLKQADVSMYEVKRGGRYLVPPQEY